MKATIQVPWHENLQDVMDDLFSGRFRADDINVSPVKTGTINGQPVFDAKIEIDLVKLDGFTNESAAKR